MSLGVLGTAFQVAFEVSPILLVDGIASKIPGGILPIAVLTEGLSIAGGVLNGAGFVGPTSRFIPMAGTTLIQQEIGRLNFYNMTTAANSVINQPNRILMQFIRPASTQDGGVIVKGLTFAAIKLALDKHNQTGGSYTILTPSYVYTGCLMRSMVDASGFSEQNKQVQYSWQFEFEQPLVKISQLESVLGGLMDKFSSGMPPSFPADTLTWSGASTGEMIPPLPQF